MEEILMILLALGAFSLFTSVLYYVLTVIAEWRIFQKMGEPGWISLIPLVRGYVMYRRTWRVQWFWIWLVLAVLSGKGLLGGENAGSLQAAAGIGMVVLQAVLQDRISRSFGHGFLFTLGLLFLNPVFLLILGLGDSVYLGNPESDF